VRKTSVVAVIVNLLLVNVENEHGLHSATNTMGWLGHNTRLWSWVRVTGLLSASLPHGHWTLGDLVSIQFPPPCVKIRVIPFLMPLLRIMKETQSVIFSFFVSLSIVY
jgi:hypothetical protein